jgi:hypothetical protein
MHFPDDNGIKIAGNGSLLKEKILPLREKKLDEFKDWVVFCLDIDTKRTHCL